MTEGNMNIYVQDNNKYIYKITEISPYSIKEKRFNKSYMFIRLELVAGIDYINTDVSDTQGYLSANNFNSITHNDGFRWLFMEESLETCLTENGYTMIKSLPKIYKK